MRTCSAGVSQSATTIGSRLTDFARRSAATFRFAIVSNRNPPQLPARTAIQSSTSILLSVPSLPDKRRFSTGTMWSSVAAGSVLNYFNYFTEIEEYFQTKREVFTRLNTLDWILIESWKEQGVPLDCVFKGI